MDLFSLIGSLGESIARMYGYKKFAPLIEANIGLLAVLISLVVISFTLLKVSRTLPAQGRTPIRNQAYLLLIKFFIGAFIVVVGFAIFAEGKKIVKESRFEKRISIHSTVIA
ncbi:hypothetical protein KKI24_28945 [bacterium]|nr:hypothetical protein [bacterium]